MSKTRSAKGREAATASLSESAQYITSVLESMEVPLRIDEAESVGKHVRANKSIAAGEALLEENPLVSWRFAQRDPSLAFRCDRCMATVSCSPGSTPEHYCEGCDVVVYCSSDCKERAASFHQFLCGSDDVLFQFTQKLESEGGADSSRFLFSPIAIARTIANIAQRYRRVLEQSRGLALDLAVQQAVSNMNNFSGAPSITESDIDLSQWFTMVRDVLTPNVNRYFSGLFDAESESGKKKLTKIANQLLSDELQGTLLGQLLFNAMSINLAYTQKTGGPSAAAVAGEVPKGGDGSIKAGKKGKGLPVCTVGAGIYLIQSCFNHSCDPNATVEFLEGNSTLTLRTLRDVATDEEVTISYLDEESLKLPVGERREKLALYLFVCECPRCTAEERKRNRGPTPSGAREAATSAVSGSKKAKPEGKEKDEEEDTDEIL
jgi:hypothetical protein